MWKELILKTVLLLGTSSGANFANLNFGAELKAQGWPERIGRQLTFNKTSVVREVEDGRRARKRKIGS